jgi:hypothetical protein
LRGQRNSPAEPIPTDPAQYPVERRIVRGFPRILVACVPILTMVSNLSPRTKRPPIELGAGVSAVAAVDYDDFGTSSTEDRMVAGASRDARVRRSARRRHHHGRRGERCRREREPWEDRLPH